MNGRFPKNENEIIISSHIISNGKVDLKIGDKIKLEVGTRQTLDGYVLKGTNPYAQKDEEGIGEEIVNTKEKEFTIVRNNI